MAKPDKNAESSTHPFAFSSRRKTGSSIVGTDAPPLPLTRFRSRLMMRFWLRSITRGPNRNRGARSGRRLRIVPHCVPLDDRIAPAIVASIPSPGTLFVGGDSAANSIAISRTAAGIILVNGATVPNGGGGAARSPRRARSSSTDSAATIPLHQAWPTADCPAASSMGVRATTS